MAFWSGYWRSLRHGMVVLVIWVKRGRCKHCRSTDALLPSFCLLRRLDTVEVTGPALCEVAAGGPVRRVAAAMGELFAYTTLRGWWRRHRERARWVGDALWPAGRRPSGEREAVAELKGLGEALSTGLGVSTWAAVSFVTGGAWLATNTTTPAKPRPDGGFMALVAQKGTRSPP